MPLKNKSSELSSRSARRQLTVRPEPYWQALEPGRLHIGYRRRSPTAAGVWLARHYIGADDRGIGRYITTTIPGFADDLRTPDGANTLSFAQAMRACFNRAAPTPRRHSQPRVSDVIADYLSYMRLERKTSADAACRAHTAILPELGARAVISLTTDELVRWRDALAAQPARIRTAKTHEQRYRIYPVTPEARRARRASVNRTLTVLKAALNRAFALGRVSDDLAWRRVKPFRETHAARGACLSVDEATRLIRAAEPYFAKLVEAALQTGCRYGELAALRCSDYSTSKIAISSSKSGRPRYVRLTDEGAAFFAQICAYRAGAETMFLRSDGSAWNKSFQARPMKAACLAAGLIPIGFHQLRHTWASLAVMNGVPLLVVATNLGHTDTRMVEKHYGHLTSTYVDEAIRRGAPRFGLSGLRSPDRPTGAEAPLDLQDFSPVSG